MSKVIRLSKRSEELIKELRDIYKDDVTISFIKDEQIIQAALAMWRANYIRMNDLKDEKE